MSRERFRMPNGQDTSDVDEAMNAWHSLAKPMEAIGWRLHSFDPGFSFVDSRNRMVELSVSQLEDILLFAAMARAHQPQGEKR